MEQFGFFKNDVGEAAQAFDEQVLGKKLGGPAGLEIAPAAMDLGIGAGLRRMKAANRMDIPSLWRALIQKPSGKGNGPTVAILAPRGTSPAEAGPKLTAAGVTAPTMAAGGDSFDCTVDAGTSSSEVVTFAVAALQAIGGLGQTAEWQWSVRKKGAVPR